MRIAQPWTHIFCHPHSSVTLWNEQLPHSPPPLSTHPCYSPAPVWASTHTALPATCWDALFYLAEERWAIPAVPSDLSWLPLWIFSKNGWSALQPVDVHAQYHPSPPKNDYWDTFWCCYLFVAFLNEGPKDDVTLRGPQINIRTLLLEFETL